MNLLFFSLYVYTLSLSFQLVSYFPILSLSHTHTHTQTHISLYDSFICCLFELMNLLFFSLYVNPLSLSFQLVSYFPILSLSSLTIHPSIKLTLLRLDFPLPQVSTFAFRNSK